VGNIGVGYICLYQGKETTLGGQGSSHEMTFVGICN
jgi:hypothetical protein